MLRKILVAAAMISAAAPVVAHHSVGSYYTEERIQIEGTVVEFLYVNPHGQLVVQDESGDYWVGELGSVLGLQRAGLTTESLPVGTKVILVAQQSRDGTNRAFIRGITVDGNMIYGNEAAR